MARGRLLHDAIRSGQSTNLAVKSDLTIQSFSQLRVSQSTAVDLLAISPLCSPLVRASRKLSCCRPFNETVGRAEVGDFPPSNTGRRGPGQTAASSALLLPILPSFHQRHLSYAAALNEARQGLHLLDCAPHCESIIFSPKHQLVRHFPRFEPGSQRRAEQLVLAQAISAQYISFPVPLNI